MVPYPLPPTGPATTYLDAAHLKDLARDIGMDLYNLPLKIVLTSKFFAAALNRGYVLMFRMSGTGIGHCTVIYGVGVPEDGKTEMVSFMDPLTVSYKNESITHLMATSTNLKFGVPHGHLLKY